MAALARPIIGLTGGIGSGKTAASDWFSAQGIVVVDADVIAHRLTQKDSPLLTTLKAAFGEWVVTPSGEYNRPAMRQWAFNDPTSLARLNAIIHPAVYQACLSALVAAKSPYAILSVPLLIEGKDKKNHSLFALCDRILVVNVDKATQVKRASLRDGVSSEQIARIIQNQASQEQRLFYADDIIDNSGTLESLYQNLLPLHQKYLTLTKK